MSDAALPPPRSFPSRVADLGFSVPLPADWISHELPAEEIDFSDPTRMVPLAVVTAPHAAIILAVAARPAYGDGTLSDWARYLLESTGLKPLALGEHVLGSLPAIVGEAVQESEMGPMRVRFAFGEDGGRLVNLSFSVPELLDPAVRHLWFQMLSGFSLASPRGSTVVLYPPAAPTPPATPTDAAAEETADTSGETSSEAPGTSPDSAGASAGGGIAEAEDQPAWWRRSRELEAQDRCPEAEEVIRQAIPYLSYAACIAEMYRDRMLRLVAAGDVGGARTAREQAVKWIQLYASLATSGGEGQALSAERDEFLAALPRL